MHSQYYPPNTSNCLATLISGLSLSSLFPLLWPFWSMNSTESFTEYSLCIFEIEFWWHYVLSLTLSGAIQVTNGSFCFWAISLYLFVIIAFLSKEGVRVQGLCPSCLRWCLYYPAQCLAHWRYSVLFSNKWKSLNCGKDLFLFNKFFLNASYEVSKNCIHTLMQITRHGTFQCLVN